MPFLMVNLDDQGDCKRAVKHLRRRVQEMQSGGCSPGQEGVSEDGSGEIGQKECEQEENGPVARRRGRRGPRGEGRPGRKGIGRKGRGRDRDDDGAQESRGTLKQKLERIRRRGVWRFLVQIAQLRDQPRSLAELDADLDLPRNKMRSTKAIFAKLEKRLGVQFLVVDEDGGEDESGNPRYVMPKRIRKQIQKFVD